MLIWRLLEIQICFDYSEAAPSIITEHFEASFRKVKFEDTLKYVAFPKIQVHPRPVLPGPVLSDSTENLREVTGKGLFDMMFFFDWLRRKKVKRILKVTVDDLAEPAHSDEAIENALRGFEVEILDWRKVDLCPETIYRSSPNLKEVYLRWSGNNVVLRAWSELDGLKKLNDLTHVYLHEKQVRSTITPPPPPQIFKRHH